MDDIARLVECPICLETFHDAVETNCGHAFCEFCIHKYLQTKQQGCPVCGKNPSPVHKSFVLREISLIYQKNSTSGHREKFFEEKEKGNENYKNSRFAESIQDYNNALVHEKYCTMAERSIVYCNRGQSYIRMSQFQRALDDCEEALRLDKNFLKAHIRKAICYLELKEHSKCKSSLDVAAKLDVEKKWQTQIQEIQTNLQTSQKAYMETNRQQHSSSPPFSFQNFFSRR